jgi:hypothetical protein
MKFRTEITIKPEKFRISHSDKIEMIGSCFVENISERLDGSGFTTDVNPFGIIYNPCSLAQSLNRLFNNKQYTENDLFKYNELYHSFSHHSRFSDVNPELVLEQINARLQHSSAFLRESTILIVTFGTAYVYRLLSTGEIVSNCHKLPESYFIRKRLSVNDILNEWHPLIERLSKLVDGIKILFTVSPIRHLKDGYHENQLSKSTLLLAINELIDRYPYCYYFPAYEILLDDLRDYRFYADDMIHPSEQAIDYIREKFSETYFDKQTQEVANEYEKLQKALNHRPFHPDLETYKNFRKQTEEKMQKISYLCGRSKI